MSLLSLKQFGNYDITHSTASSTNPNIITSDDKFTVYTNKGASELNVHELPAPEGGLEYYFAVYSSVGIEIQASSGQIQIDDVLSTDGIISSTQVGAFLIILGLDNSTWLATSVVGTWVP